LLHLEPMFPGLNAIFENMTRDQPAERCNVREAFERFSKLRDSQSEEQLASSVPRSKTQYMSDEALIRLRDSAMAQYPKERSVALS
jgi:hypothetical protein